MKLTTFTGLRQYKRLNRRNNNNNNNDKKSIQTTNPTNSCNTATANLIQQQFSIVIVFNTWGYNDDTFNDTIRMPYGYTTYAQLTIRWMGMLCVHVPLSKKITLPIAGTKKKKTVYKIGTRQIEGKARSAICDTIC